MPPLSYLTSPKATYDPGATSSPAPDDSPEVPPNVNPIVSRWQRLTSIDRQSPRFLPYFCLLPRGPTVPRP